MALAFILTGKYRQGFSHEELSLIALMGPSGTSFLLAACLRFETTCPDWGQAMEDCKLKSVFWNTLFSPLFWMDLTSCLGTGLSLALPFECRRLPHVLALLRYWRFFHLNHALRLLKYIPTYVFFSSVVNVFLLQHLLVCVYRSLTPPPARLLHDAEILRFREGQSEAVVLGGEEEASVPAGAPPAVW